MAQCRYNSRAIHSAHLFDIRFGDGLIISHDREHLKRRRRKRNIALHIEHASDILRIFLPRAQLISFAELQKAYAALTLVELFGAGAQNGFGILYLYIESLSYFSRFYRLARRKKYSLRRGAHLIECQADSPLKISSSVSYQSDFGIAAVTVYLNLFRLDEREHRHKGCDHLRARS